MYEKICWAALELMHGKALNEIPKMENDATYIQFRKALVEFNRACQLRAALTLIKTESIAQTRREKNKSLIKVVELLEDVLNGNLHLASECNADRPPTAGIRHALDNEKSGYSRDAFKKIESKTISDQIALAIACYLLRAHSLFFCRDDNQCTFNAAKVTLNDLHQAYQLSWRLYHVLPQCHHQDSSRSLQAYLNEVIAPLPADGPGIASPRFVWNALLLCDIFRGNVYRKIGFQERADKHYRHAENRFALIEKHLNDPDRAASSDFASPTVIRALFERSKVLFDLGHLLESLQRQVKCLELLVRQNKATGKGKTDLIKRLAGIWRYQDAERCLPVYDRTGITASFKSDGQPSLSRQLKKNILECHAPLVSAILARIGFTIYTIVPHGNNPIDGETRKWLLEYYQFDRKWNQGTLDKIRPSRLGIYGQTLISKSNHNTSIDKSVFADQIERRFALLLRRMRLSGKRSPKNLDAVTFYKNILGSTTQNIGNIVTIPRQNQRLLMRRGYVHRRTYGELGRKRVYNGLLASLGIEGELVDVQKSVNKLVVLRRWQSFNPKIPRPPGVSVRGGGYFLLWQGKGVVIDPGYNFIQTFYDEGFSLEDIDAIVITHSHPDHDDDFATLMTLMKEWNDFYERTGDSRLCKRWDFFLNESTHKKFSSWLQASDVKFGRIIPLPSLWWDKDTSKAEKGPFRGKSVVLNLQALDKAQVKLGMEDKQRMAARDPEIDAERNDQRIYHMALEVIPAWHDDVIGRTAAVGLKIHLYHPGSNKLAGVIGYTGDTGAYGLHIAKADDIPPELRIDHHYRDCDVLIAHLGDIRLRELSSVMAAQGSPWQVQGSDKSFMAHPLLQLLRSWFEVGSTDKSNPVKLRDKVRQFLDFAITLELIPSWALQMQIPLQTKKTANLSEEVQHWLGTFIRKRDSDKMTWLQDDWFLYTKGLDAIKEHARDIGEPLSSIASKKFENELHRGQNIGNTISSEPAARDAYRLLEFLCIASLTTWQYPYHLGVFGLYRLFSKMANYQTENPGDKVKPGRVFIVGELPEELTSYRHAVACWLNQINANKVVKEAGIRPVYAFTGDIGMHIGLLNRADGEKGSIEPSIRCSYCNQNNETACAGDNYHPPHEMREFAIKRQQASMIYLCTTKDHSPEGDDVPLDFLNRPERN